VSERRIGECGNAAAAAPYPHLKAYAGGIRSLTAVALKFYEFHHAALTEPFHPGYAAWISRV
jgi:hypothetical protein